MTINGEPVELVTAFSSLRAGDVVWVVDCNNCASGKHRGILLGLSRHAGFSVFGVDRPGTWWVLLPLISCVRRERLGPGAESGVGPGAVAAGIVYRVTNPPRAVSLHDAIHEQVSTGKFKVRPR